MRRLRPPRYIPAETILQPYICHEAEGVQLLSVSHDNSPEDDFDVRLELKTSMFNISDSADTYASKK